MNILSVIIYFSLKTYKSATRVSRNIRLKRKVKKLLKTKGVKKLTNSQNEEIKAFYKTFGIKSVSILWHKYYFNCSGNFSEKYLPENLFYLKVEPKLNRAEYDPALADKNLLDSLFPNIKKPETVVKNINGFYYFNKKLIKEDEAIRFCNLEEPLIIKPTLETGGGKNVLLFETENGVTNCNNKTVKQLLDSYKKDFIVQKVVAQHQSMNKLNPTSLNTFRVMTYLKNNNDIQILSTVVRMGREGSVTDNATTGGLCCGVKADGKLSVVGYHNNTGDSFFETDGGIKFKDIELPFTEEVNTAAKRLHRNAPWFRLISWDLTINDLDEIVLMEFNVGGQDINLHQLINGPVLSILLEELRS